MYFMHTYIRTYLQLETHFFQVHLEPCKHQCIWSLLGQHKFLHQHLKYTLQSENNQQQLIDKLDGAILKWRIAAASTD